jgi:tRNA-splicing ligase RtcB (3'-phosphate/5'-hydroxy nucleic acid ligase)
MKLQADGPYRFRLDPKGEMRVPGVVFASQALLRDADKAIDQVANVATLPGIVGASYAMPDVHWGYGFAIGGVAATDPAAGGVVSPGGVGFDISCGVRLLAAEVEASDVRPVLEPLMDGLDPAIPRGAGPGGVWSLTGKDELIGILTRGSAYAVERGHGDECDLLRCEDQGAVADADPDQVSARAVERGLGQVGSLGSGNHFLEVQRVADVYDTVAAEAFGLRHGQVCVMIHCGSRGLGHQICTDHVRAMDKRMPSTASRSPTGSSPAPPWTPPPAGPTSGLWRRRPTTAGPTGNCSPRPPGASSTGSPGPGSTSSTTCPITSPRSRSTSSTGSGGGCACTARARPGRSRPDTPSCRRTWAPWASRC